MLDVDGNFSVMVEDGVSLIIDKGGIVLLSGINQGILVKVGDGMGKLDIKFGEESKDIKGKFNYIYNKWYMVKYKDLYICEIYGWDFYSVFGFNMIIYYGVLMEFVYGVWMQFDKFNFMLDWLLLNWKGIQIDFKGIVMKKLMVKFGVIDCLVEWNEIMVGLQGLKVDVMCLEVKCKELVL